MNGRLQFIRLRTIDIECRCCGKGRQDVCPKCDDMLHNGYAFFIEVKDNSTEVKKKPTGYAIALRADQMYEHGQPGVVMQAGIYFIRQTDLKLLLGNDYNNPRTVASGGANGRLLISVPRQIHAHAQPTIGARQAVELCHG